MGNPGRRGSQRVENILMDIPFYCMIASVQKKTRSKTENTMIKIMIVDDDPQVTTLLRRYLSAKSFEVTTINQSAKALSTAHLIHPDLFILDLMMPPPDGFELCRQLRADPNFARVPILIITAMDISNSSATSFGANDYLAKPFSFDDVITKINFLLNNAE